MSTTVFQRLTLILEDKQVSVNALSKQINMSQTTLNTQLKGERALSATVVEKILETYPDVSADWVMRGKGTMYSNSELDMTNPGMVAEPTPQRMDIVTPKPTESIWKAKYEAIKECYDMLVSSLGGNMGKRNVG